MDGMSFVIGAALAASILGNYIKESAELIAKAIKGNRL